MSTLKGIRLYQERSIESLGVLKKHQWDVKVYTIFSGSTFEYSEILEQYFTQMDEILEKATTTDLPVYHVGFLIAHQGTDRLWFLFNWWTGGEMIESVVHYVDYAAPKNVNVLKGRSLVCVWELEIFAHERQSWIEFVLKKPNQPRMDDYLQHSINSSTNNF